MQRGDLRLSLRIRIIAVLSAVLSAGAVVLGLAAWQYALIAAQQAYDRLLSGATIQVAENVYVQGGVVALDPPVAAFSTLSAYDLVYYKVVDPRGVIVAGYEDLTSSATPAAMRSGIVLEDGHYQNHPVRIATIARRIDDKDAGQWATIIVAQTVNARTALARDLTFKAFAVIAAMSVLALLAVGLAVRFGLKPLALIEQEIVGRRPDDLRPIEAGRPVEIRNLVQAIDDFMRRLSERMALMQRFIADAAHQIRTPLAALDAQVELLSGPQGTRRRAEHLARVRERTTELARLTQQLLDHAMVTHRADMAQTSSLDLNEVAKATLAKSVPLTLAREVDIAFEPASPAPQIEGDAISVREALANLIDNALVHGAKSRLVVAVGQAGDRAWIEVRDDGGGFYQVEGGKLVAPFQKGERSAGSGLGLAIADEVARAHGGALEFAEEGGLTVVRLCLSVSRE
ncbi:sensor histidine kinase [Labrys okinawensis]|uniref:histidine kinase n=1 Tax=Labrys okinawensis TaxID=346911 RepID=A0A2S9QE41_9HYPH|nr:sensor histidine kinase [Labrys okinawensis]PRH87595.1 sensor histidine kinase [Labrys okinawensis]